MTQKQIAKYAPKIIKNTPRFVLWYEIIYSVSLNATFVFYKLYISALPL